MKNLRLKAMLLTMSVGIGFAGIANAGPDEAACASLEISCEEGSWHDCKLYSRYCR